MSLRVYNTLTRKKEDFIPRENGKVFMYVCGPTVYNYIHIGNARCYLAFDAIKRYLEHKGFKVIYARNITDVDDKIINRAREEGTTPSEIALKYTRAFEEDMKLLGVKEPSFSPKATEYISDMIEVIKALVDKGYAYVVDGDVYFEVAKFSDYGKLSKKTLDELRAGERVEPDPRKRHPLDFALWKKAKESEPFWESPWGKGRPGWHIECSTMSVKHLGFSFDIHGGGQDLIFPHHENEIAQAEACFGKKPFVRYWLHNGFVNIKKQKMAKSLGNIILVRELFKKKNLLPRLFSNSFRMLVLSTHYRSPIDFSENLFEEAKEKYLRFTHTLGDVEEAIEFGSFSEEGKNDELLEEKIKETEREFHRAMDDDFNTPAALASIFKLIAAVQLVLKEKSCTAKILREAARILRNFMEVLGFSLPPAKSLELGYTVLKEELSGLTVREPLTSLLDKFFAYLADLKKEEDFEKEEELKRLAVKITFIREEARKEKNWELADKIREELAFKGVLLQDRRWGTRWLLV